MSSIREIAERIADGWSHDVDHNIVLVNTIEQALCDRDDRAAKIAEKEHSYWWTASENYKPDDPDAKSMC